MTLDRPRVSQNLKDFDFRRLFTQELGWDHHRSTVEVTVEGQSFTLTAVAEKRGMVAFNYAASDAEGIPPYALRRKIERQVSKSAHEHLVIFTDQPKTTQVWQWVKREVGRPTACREHTYHRSQSGEALIQKLESLEFSLEEEENLTVVDVAGRARAAFDVDRITKRFYDRFKTEHTAFLKFIKGIPSEDDQAWYASLMLNRLMFVYFIQKKGFLDNDPDYLRNRLSAMQQQHGKDKFYSFYRQFLLRLFHEGLNQPFGNRVAGLDALIGNVPYLNGGLFDVHRLEERNPEIAITDKAFQRLFDFFDAYQWHLDERPLRADNEINPDVLGYIFEKYINQRQMGAYYTKEDITGYIAQNTVIPFLFDAAEKKCPAAFKPGSSLWQLLCDDPDRYIYAAVRHGVDAPLPKAISAGLDNVSKRDGWNQAAAGEYALPTETWREHVTRRDRCLELRRKLAAGEVYSINDLITLNLDIRQFAQDAIENCETPELLRAFYRAICSASVLDPTCGSGAFLFAELNILEPLYEACLERMQAFLNEFASLPPDETTPETMQPTSVQSPDVPSSDWLAAEDQTTDVPEPPSAAGAVGKAAKPKLFSDFRRTLAEVSEHPSSRYFIVKSIIIGNLYGVDIMEEAVEICKLRLFLKLVAQIDRIEQVEPLPDVDFNIRAGNTLVGYVSLDAIRRAVERERGGQKKLAFSDAQEEVDAIAEKAEIADRAYQKFREMQTRQGMDASLFTEAKRQLRARLDALSEQLDRYLAAEHGVPARNRDSFAAWHETNQPFHWFVEFFGIMRRGGFDVVIGNPPYVVCSASNVRYRIDAQQYRTLPTKNLYALVWERSIDLARQRSPIGLIVQLTILSSERLPTLQDLLAQRGHTYAISFPRRPESIFDGVEMPVAITISYGKSQHEFTTSRVRRFYTQERAHALTTTPLTRHAIRISGYRIAKIGTSIEASIVQKITKQPLILESLMTSTSKEVVYYQEACRYWLKACPGLPFFRRNGERMAPPHGRVLHFSTKEGAAFAACLLNSSLFYWFYSAFCDCEHVNDGVVRGFFIPQQWNKMQWASMSTRLLQSLADHARRKVINTAQGHTIEYDEMKALFSKDVIDEVDRALGAQYGFTHAEVDFLVNYDIKYRVGSETEEDAET